MQKRQPSTNNHNPFRLRFHHHPKSQPNKFRFRSKHNSRLGLTKSCSTKSPFRLHKTRYLGFYASCAALGLLLLAMIFPIDATPASAEDGIDAQAEARLTVGSSLGLTIQDAAPMHITPTPAGKFSSGSAAVTVKTTARGGYNIFVSAKSGSSNGNRMVNTADSTKYIAPVSGTVTPVTMTKDTWGYALARGAGVDMNAYEREFKTMPTSVGSTPVVMGSANLAGTLRSDPYTLGFGTKASIALPAGEYVADVTISVIAKPEPLTQLQQITYMQEMTSAICRNTYTPFRFDDDHAEKQLIDQRDGKAYWVTKMIDGNCWMTQNLALDINGTKTYSGGFKGISSGSGVPVASTTDGAVKLWSGNASQSDTYGNLPKITESTTGGVRSDYNYDTRSWNFGSYVLTTPIASQNCTGNSDNQIQSLSGCSSVVTNVGNYSQVPYKVYGAGQGYKYTGDGNTINGSYYDAHYLVGNYYQYNTAMAGSAGTTIESSGATPAWSICPAGADSGANWRPAVGDSNWVSGDTKSESFANLFVKYRIDNNSDKATVNMRKLPAAFLSAGGVNLYYGFLDRVGYDGFYWSRTVSRWCDAYTLYFGSSSSGGRAIGGRDSGHSLRCLYPGT